MKRGAPTDTARLGQAPAFAVAGLVQAALLLHLLLNQVPARVVPLPARLAVAAAIICLVIAAIAVTFIWSYDSGSKGVKVFDWMLKAELVAVGIFDEDVA